MHTYTHTHAGIFTYIHCRREHLTTHAYVQTYTHMHIYVHTLSQGAPYKQRENFQTKLTTDPVLQVTIKGAQSICGASAARVNRHFVHTHTHMHSSVHVYTYAFVCVCERINQWLPPRAFWAESCMYAHTCIHTCNLYIYIYIYTHIYIYIYIHIRVYKHV
jgi:hypothetical protein